VVEERGALQEVDLATGARRELLAAGDLGHLSDFDFLGELLVLIGRVPRAGAPDDWVLRAYRDGSDGLSLVSQASCYPYQSLHAAEDGGVLIASPIHASESPSVLLVADGASLRVLGRVNRRVVGVSERRGEVFLHCQLQDREWLAVSGLQEARAALLASPAAAPLTAL
jgi:hypothetical protein